jgi:hypothetical protein
MVLHHQLCFLCWSWNSSTFGKALGYLVMHSLLLEVFRRLHQCLAMSTWLALSLLPIWWVPLVMAWCFFNTWKWVIVINDITHLFYCPRPCWEGKGYVKLLKSILRSFWSVTLLLVLHV